MKGSSSGRSLRLELFAVCGIATIATFAFRWGQLGMPLFYADEFYLSAIPHHYHATRFAVVGNPGPMEIFHPHLYYIVLATLTRIFGWKMQVLHGAALLVSSLFAATVYALARMHASRSASAVAAVGFFVSGLYLSRSISIEPDFPAAVLTLLSLMSLLRNSPGKGALFFALACLCNGPVVIFTPCFAYTIFRRCRGPRFLPVFIRFFTPTFVGLFAWCLYFLISAPDLEDIFHREKNFAFLGGFRYVLERLLKQRPYEFFVESGRAVFSLTVLGWSVWRPRWSHAGVPGGINASESRRAVFAVISVQFLFLSFFGTEDIRYAAVSIALVYVLGAWALTGMGTLLYLQLAALAVVSMSSLRAWSRPVWVNNRGSYRSSYLDRVRNMRELAKDLAREHPRAAVYAPWPWAVALESRRTGYSSRSFETIMIGGDLDGIRIPASSEKKAFLLFHSPADPPEPDLSAGVIELRKRAVGPCRSWERPYSRFYLCSLN